MAEAGRIDHAGGRRAVGPRHDAGHTMPLIAQQSRESLAHPGLVIDDDDRAGPRQLARLSHGGGEDCSQREPADAGAGPRTFKRDVMILRDMG